MNITFIGLGIMGREMVTNLLETQISLTVYNRTLETAKAFKAKGAKVALTLSEAVSDADLVISMLSTPAAVEQVFLSADGALSKMRSGSTWIDCSTVDPAFSRKCDQIANQHKINFTDAPVAGSKPQAAAAALSFFTGATEEQIQPYKEILLAMGQKVIPFDKVGQGSAFKMVVNMLLGQSMVIFCEALELGNSLDLDQDFLLNTLPKLPVTAPFTAFKTDNIRSGNYPPDFPLELMLKDMRLATFAYANEGKRLSMAETAKSAFERANEAGYGRADFSAVYTSMEN